MVKLKGPLFSTSMRMWLGKDMYGARQYRNGVWVEPKGLVANPYPIGLLGHIHVPYSLWDRDIHGMYTLPAFGINPYAKFIAQYYSPRGWAYQMRRTWHGVIPIAMLPPDNDPVRTPAGLAAQASLADAVTIWQAMSANQKNVYNVLKEPQHTSGFNKWISRYIKTTARMPIYWGTLQRSAVDPQSIEDKMVDQDTPVIRYPFNFRQYQLFNPVFHMGNGFPENPVKGQFFYREDEDILYKYNGAAWGEIGGGVGGGHTIQDEGVSLPTQTKLNFYGLGVTAGDDPGNARTNVYIPTQVFLDTRVATVVVAADGSGDFTDIQDGIDALPAGGGNVYVKNGVYDIATPILIHKSYVTLEGAGKSTVLKPTAANADEVIQIGDGVNPYEHITVKNLMINGDNANVDFCEGIYIRTYADHVSILNNYFYDNSSIAIRQSSLSYYLEIVGNTIENTGSYAIGLYKAPDVLVQGNNIINSQSSGGSVINCSDCPRARFIGNSITSTALSTAGSGINITDDGPAAEFVPNDIVIIGNTMVGCYHGIIQGGAGGSGQKTTIIGNTIRNSYRHGIYYPLNRSVISANIIENVGEEGIFINGQYIAAVGNQINTCGKRGILIWGTDNTIKDNHIQFTQWDGINIASGQRNLIQGNRILYTSRAANNLFSAIYVEGTVGTKANENSIFDNVIQLPSSGNMKAYSIREYGAYCDYNLLRGNRCRNAVRKEIQVIGVNSEAFDNQTIGV